MVLFYVFMASGYADVLVDAQVKSPLPPKKLVLWLYLTDMSINITTKCQNIEEMAFLTVSMGFGLSFIIKKAQNAIFTQNKNPCFWGVG